MNLAALVKQKNKMSRLNGLDIEFKDQRYHINQVYKKQDAKAREKLYFKLLDIKQNKRDGQAHLQSQMIKLSSPSLDAGMGQLRVNLAQQGFKCLEPADRFTVELEEFPAKITVSEGQVQIEGTENLEVLKRLSEVVKVSFKLI